MQSKGKDSASINEKRDDGGNLHSDVAFQKLKDGPDIERNNRVETSLASNRSRQSQRRGDSYLLANDTSLDSSRFTIRSYTSRAVIEGSNKENAWRMLGLFILVGAIIGGSSIGTLANFIPVETSFAKNAWRSGIVATLFIVPAIVEYFKCRAQVNYAELINPRQYMFLLATLCCQVAWTFGLIYASLNTIQSHAYVFNNIHGLFIVLIGYFIGVIPSRKENIGVMLAITGCVFMILDPQAARASTDGEEAPSASLVPALVDITSALFGALYFLMSARNVKNLPICLLILIMNIHTFLINSSIAKFSNPEIEIFSLDPQYGCLGFLNPSNSLVAVGAYAIFASFFGSAGYVLCLLFYSPLVTSNAYLLEPFFAQTLGYLMGLDQLPGMMTAFGTLFSIIGIMYIDSGSRERLALVSVKEGGDTSVINRSIMSAGEGQGYSVLQMSNMSISHNKSIQR